MNYEYHYRTHIWQHRLAIYQNQIQFDSILQESTNSSENSQSYQCNSKP